MCTYLKNMKGYKLNDLKLKEFDSIQEMFDRAFKRVNTFEDFRTELVEGKEKRARIELVQEITKKQKVEDDKETAELKQRMEIIPDEEEVAIDAIPLAVKSQLHAMGNVSSIPTSQPIASYARDGLELTTLDHEILGPNVKYIPLYNRYALESTGEITKDGKVIGYSQNSKPYIILNKHTRKVEESLVTFDETPPPSKTSLLVDDDLDEEEAIKVTEKKNLENDIEDETLEIDKIVNIKESRNHPLENARLVTQEYNQQEGIDYDETYAPVARLESIRILLAYACALDFKLFQMDVKSASLNGFINEEVYMAQPLGFIDFEKPNHVYKLKKALYSLKQEPKAWYDRLKAFLIKHEYKIGMVDNTLFTKKKSSNLIIVQIYVDEIIFGSTCQDICDEFAKIMHDEFEISMMGELNFFLRLQIKQIEDGIFFNQSKYMKEMLKKFSLEEYKPMKTLMSFDTKLTKDEECESVDSTKYRGMIGSLLYLTTSRPDIMFSVCLCARFQEAPKTSYLEAVKRIFQYIKGTKDLGLWYPKGTDIETVVYANSDHAGDYVDRKSTSGICTFMGCCLTSWLSKK
ncbi:retrovirus-related pol polyprotein from transposon TNT 1-94 [Tanacetum coccineum]